MPQARCARGHPLGAKDRRKDGRTQCLLCHRAEQKAYRERKKSEHTLSTNQAAATRYWGPPAAPAPRKSDADVRRGYLEEQLRTGRNLWGTSELTAEQIADLQHQLAKLA